MSIIDFLNSYPEIYFWTALGIVSIFVVRRVVR